MTISSFDLSALNGSNGFTLSGLSPGDFLGSSASNAGDINGDGISDLIIGARFASPNNNSNGGASYVIFGRPGGFPANASLASLNGSNGFAINGIDPNELSGASVSSAGDVNGDGIDDLLIGAPAASPNGQPRAGRSYVVFGKTSGWSPAVNLSELNGSNGFVINGQNREDFFGTSVSSAGDINGDGIDDIIVGARFASVNDPQFNPPSRVGAGKSYVIFGKRGGWDSQLNLSNLNGSNGFVINGINPNDFSGSVVTDIGDMNGDGINDLAISAPNAAANGKNATGATYVIFGKTTGWSNEVNLLALNGSNGFIINGADANDSTGAALSSADLNNDGLADLIIGAPNASPNSLTAAGKTYVIFGKKGAFDRNVNLSSLTGSNGFAIGGINAGDELGISVSGLNDINRDGIDDFIIGAKGADPNGQTNAGTSYVVFGRTGGFGPAFNLSQLNGNNGFPIAGIEAGGQFGALVSNAGDLNRDGLNDFLVAAPAATINGNRNAGRIYTIFGSPLFGSPSGQPIEGTAQNDTLVGTNGNDTIRGLGGDDAIIGLSGNDSLSGDDGNDFINGNAGNDTLLGGEGQDVLYGGRDDDLVFGNNGQDLLFGNSGNDQLVGGAGNDTLFGGKGNDTLAGDQGDDFLRGDAGLDVLFGGEGRDTFALAENGGRDIILDFQLGQDLLGLAGNLTFNQLTISQLGNAATITVTRTGEVLAVLNGVAASAVGIRDFVGVRA
ncbi:MAG: hypothetical protein ACM37W_21315 [Actinomycetota bacterium]